MDCNGHVRGLLGLPDEVLVHIIGFVTSQDDLSSVARIKHLNGLAEPTLYNEIDISSGRKAAVLARAITKRPSRATWIKSLLVSTTFGDDIGLEKLPPLIRMMRNLQDLRLETPDCNKRDAEDRVPWMQLQDRYERIFEESSAVMPADRRLLPNLQSCTMHFVDATKEIYPLSRYAMLFLHPTLQSLTIPCASTDIPKNLLSNFQDDVHLLKSTDLHHLHLEECDIYPPSLAILLSFAKRLRSFRLSEGTRYTPNRGYHPRLHGDVNPAELVEALKQHCTESLEWLSLTLGYMRSAHQHIDQYGQHLNVSAFTNVKHLEVDMITAFLLVPLTRCDHGTWKRFPPALKSLKVFEIKLFGVLVRNPPFSAAGREYWPFEDCVVKEKVRHGLANLEVLIYSFDTLSQEDDDDDAEEEDQEMREVETHNFMRSKNNLIAAAATSYPIFKKARIRLLVELVSLPPGFIPPYLSNEESPKTYTIWDRPV